MSKHTPGPWVLATYTRHDEVATVAHVGDYVVGVPTPGYPGGNYRDTEYGADEADARLIAAAPTLLAALLDARDALHRCEFAGQGGGAVAASLININAAIAKATGENT